jgi:hypothetical protein
VTCGDTRTLKIIADVWSISGGHVANLRQDLDGVDHWDSLVYNLPSPRTQLLHNIDERGRTAAIRLHNWKLVIGKGRNISGC